MKMKRLSKKGFNLTEVPSLVIVLLVIAIVLGVGSTINGQIKSTQCLYTYDATTGVCLNSTGGSGVGTLGTTVASNITQDGLDSQEDMSEWQSTWVVIVAAAVVIGIVGRYLFFK